MESGTVALPSLEVLGTKFSNAQQQLTEVEQLYKQIERRISSLEHQSKKIQAQLYKSQKPLEDAEKIDFYKRTIAELESKHKRAEKCKEQLQNFVERLAGIQVMYAAKSQKQIVEEIIEEDQSDLNHALTNNHNTTKKGSLISNELDGFQTRARRQTRIVRSNVVFEVNKFRDKFKLVSRSKNLNINFSTVHIRTSMRKKCVFVSFCYWRVDDRRQSYCGTHLLQKIFTFFSRGIPTRNFRHFRRRYIHFFTRRMVSIEL